MRTYRPPRTREQDTKQFSTDVRLPYSLVSKHPQKEHKKMLEYKLDPTEDREGILIPPVE